MLSSAPVDFTLIREQHHNLAYFKAAVAQLWMPKFTRCVGVTARYYIVQFGRNLSSTPAMSQQNELFKVNDTIELTHSEEELFMLLQNVVHHFKLRCQPRVAGGWVRDKLLGRDSLDLDIAVNDMSGNTFAQYLTQYQEQQNLRGSRLTVINANPDQSKHLETVKAIVCDTELDFSSMREETYTSNADHRIPASVKLASASVDAHRRDFTLNSLFYNIMTREVEDFTGKGLKDLRAGRLRPPIDPVTTLLDDPLRLLRGVRFSCIYGFTPDPEFMRAAQDACVHEALRRKVSRERVSIELVKICRAPTLAFADGFKLLKRAGVIDIVFLNARENLGSNWDRAAIALEALTSLVQARQPPASMHMQRQFSFVPGVDHFAEHSAVKHKRPGHPDLLHVVLTAMLLPYGQDERNTIQETQHRRVANDQFHQKLHEAIAHFLHVHPTSESQERYAVSVAFARAISQLHQRSLKPRVRTLMLDSLRLSHADFTHVTQLLLHAHTLHAVRQGVRAALQAQRDSGMTHQLRERGKLLMGLWVAHAGPVWR